MSDIDQTEGTRRVHWRMGICLHAFQIKFLDAPTSRSDAAFERFEIMAADPDAAIWKVADMPWPSGARACHVTDFEGREVAYQFGAILNGRRR